jgi:hypothetical protein
MEPHVAPDARRIKNTFSRVLTKPFRQAVRHRNVRVLGVVLLCIAMLSFCSYLTTHFADSLTITVISIPQGNVEPPESTIFSRTYHDATLVRQIQTEINGIPRLNPALQMNCSSGFIDPIYVYTFSFRWLNLPVESATVNTEGCAFWTITTLDPSILFPRMAYDEYACYVQLGKLTGMPYQISTDSWDMGIAKLGAVACDG